MQSPTPRPRTTISSDPQRTCVGCRRVGAPHTLVRCVMTDEGPRIGRSLPGRGAWLCPGEQCATMAIERGTLARSLGMSRTQITEEQAARLIARCGASVTQRADEASLPTM